MGPPAGPEVTIFDPTGLGRVCQPWEEGEIAVRGPCSMIGYEVDGQVQPKHKDGWIMTGDKGYFDDQGALTLVGRFKELINRAGEKISPFAIEERVFQELSGQPEGSDLQFTVFAAPHRQLGECVAIAVATTTISVPYDGNALPITLQDLRARLQKQGILQANMVPECIVYVSRLPVGRTGKPLRIGLAKLWQLPELDAAKDFASAWWVDVDHLELAAIRLEITSAGLIKQGCSASQPTPSKSILTKAPTTKSLTSVVRRVAASVLGNNQLRTDLALASYGLDSIQSTVFLERLGDALAPLATSPSVDSERSLPENLTSQFPSIKEIVAALLPKLVAAHGQLGKLKDHSLTALKSSMSKSASRDGNGLAFAKQGAVENLRSLLREGWDPDGAADRFGTTSLQWAAGSNHIGAVQVLLDGGADVNRGNKEGRTALMWACRNGHLRMVQVLLAAGGRLDITTKKGVTCLHWAVWGANIPTVRLLVDEQGMDLECLSHAGCNAAIWAAASGSQEVCDFLLERGADFERLNYWGHGVVVKTAWRGHLQLLKHLIARVPKVEQQLFYRNPVGELPLDIARQAGHEDVIAFLESRMAELALPVVPCPLEQAPKPHQHKQMLQMSLAQRMEVS